MFLIAFKNKKAEPNLTHSLMAYVLNSDFIHCEFIFDDGKIGSSGQWRGVGLFDDNEVRNQHWEYYEIPYKYQTQTRNYIIRKSGKPYNWAGIWGQMVGKILPISSEGFACSDLCYVALKNAGLPLPNHNPDSVSPNDLRIMIQSLNLKRVGYVR